MPENDKNETFTNLTVTNSITDPGETTHTGTISGDGSGGLALENTDGTTLLTTETLQAGTDLQFSDDGDGTATLDATVDTFSGSHTDLTDVADDAHHAKTQPSDIDSSNWDDYEIQVDGTDGPGIINFKTQ